VGNEHTEARARIRANRRARRTDERRLLMDGRLSDKPERQRQVLVRAFALADAHHWLCGLCDLPMFVNNVTIDHVISRSSGGCVDASDSSHAACDVRAAHERCAKKKGTLAFDEWIAQRDVILGDAYRLKRERIAKRSSNGLRAILLRQPITAG
jgi:5-methylcytosine-specific restriction endonuclease McrA